MAKSQELLEARLRYENSRMLRDRAERIYEADAHAYDTLLLGSKPCLCGDTQSGCPAHPRSPVSGGTVDG